MSSGKALAVVLRQEVGALQLELLGIKSRLYALAFPDEQGKLIAVDDIDIEHCLSQLEARLAALRWNTIYNMKSPEQP